MRRCGVRLCRASGSGLISKQVAPVPAHNEASKSVAKRSSLPSKLAHSVTSPLARQADAVGEKLFRGSSDGTAYAADSAVLSEHFGPKRTVQKVTVRDPVHSPVTASTPVEREPTRSLAELQALPAAELKRMLAARGVGAGNATEKAELARWAHQHQDLPVLRKGPAQPPKPPVSGGKSLAELGRMPVKELHEMLRERNVQPSSASEKDELAKWVWQHQHLPVVPDQHRKARQSRPGQRGWGAGGESSPHDSPRDEQKDQEQEKLDSPSPDLLESGDSRPLLEGRTEEEEEAKGLTRLILPVLCAVGAVGTVMILLATSDARRFTQEVEDE